MKKQYYLSDVWSPVYEDDANAAAAAAEAAAAEAAAAAAGGIKFNEEQQKFVNKLLADDRKKHTVRTEKAIQELEALKKRSSLTEKERKDLEDRIDNMKSELMTKEELAAKERDKLLSRHKEEVTGLTTELDTWKGRFTSSTISRAITDAAVTHDAYSPEQIVALLQTRTQLVEDLDDEGKPTGVLTPKVKFEDVGKDNKPVTLDLSVEEAVKRMSELDKYLNLFKDKGTGGLGGSNRSAGGGKTDAKTIAQDPAKYREARKKGTLTF